MKNQKYQRIAIVGCAGTGKTTLAVKLGERLGLPAHHLDHYYWKPGRQRANFEEFSTMHSNLCDEDAWIIEGPYVRILPYRAFMADCIIFLDLPRRICLWNVLKRAVCNRGKVLPGGPPEYKQELLSFGFAEFLSWIWNFNKRYRNMILQTLDDERKDGKQIYILRSFEALDELCEQLGKCS